MEQQELKRIVNYNPETGKMTWKAPRRGCVVGSEVGTITKFGYRNVYLAGRRYHVHRLAWLYVYGRFPKDQIDHINMNGLDNRLCNLREATQSQNQANKGMRADNTSGVKGVTWDSSRKKWKASISVSGKMIHLGRFSEVRDAAEAYRIAAKKYFGDFARPVRFV